MQAVRVVVKNTFLDVIVDMNDDPKPMRKCYSDYFLFDSHDSDCTSTMADDITDAQDVSSVFSGSEEFEACVESEQSDAMTDLEEFLERDRWLTESRPFTITSTEPLREKFPQVTSEDIKKSSAFETSSFPECSVSSLPAATQDVAATTVHSQVHTNMGHPLPGLIPKKRDSNRTWPKLAVGAYVGVICNGCIREECKATSKTGMTYQKCRAHVKKVARGRVLLELVEHNMDEFWIAQNDSRIIHRKDETWCEHGKLCNRTVRHKTCTKDTCHLHFCHDLKCVVRRAK